MKRNRQKQNQPTEQADNAASDRKNQDPRLTIYNEKALSLVDSFLITNNEDGNETVSKLQAEKDLQAEVKKYMAILDAGNAPAGAAGGQKSSANQLEGQNGADDGQPSELQQKQLLEDFYKQMNIDAEAEFNKHLERKQGLEQQQPMKTGDNELINGHNRLSEQDLANKRRHDTFYEHFKEDFTQESIDMIRFIDWNERRHIVDA